MKAKTTETVAVIALAMALVVVLLCFRSAAAELVYPIERLVKGVSRRAAVRLSGMCRGASAAAENGRLRREVASLSFLRGEVERLEAENARLRRALGYRERMQSDWVPAAVLSRGGAASGARHTLRVDKGTLDGLVRGAIAVVPEGLVGRVCAVSPHTADILLLTDQSLKVACEVESASGLSLRGILSGGSDERLVLRYLGGATTVPVRARVLTSGLGGVFPKGLEVGTLLGIRKGSDELASEGEVLPAVDFSVLEDVFIRREK